MADTQSIDIMEHVFGKVILPDVQVSTDNLHHEHELDDRQSRASSIPPVPKQRHEHHHSHEKLNKDAEFQSAVIPLDEAITYDQILYRSRGNSSLNELKKRTQSDVTYDEIPYEHEHEIHDQLLDGHSVRSEHTDLHPIDHIEPLHYEHDDVHLSTIDDEMARGNRVLAELKERHFHDNYDSMTITTSKTSELANEYDLYSTPLPGAQENELNEQTDDSGTETEEVQPVNRTKYLFDSNEAYQVERAKMPDTFQIELGQRVSSYGEQHPISTPPPRPAHGEKPASKRASNASNFVVSTFGENSHERIKSDISADVNIENLRHKFEHPHVHKHIDHHHPIIRTSSPSYKNFVGRKPQQPQIRRSESIASTLTLGTENFTREAYPSYRFAQHSVVSPHPPVIYERPTSAQSHQHHKQSIRHQSIHEELNEPIYENELHRPVNHEHRHKTYNSLQRNGLEYQAPHLNSIHQSNHVFLSNEQKSRAILDKYHHSKHESFSDLPKTVPHETNHVKVNHVDERHHKHSTSSEVELSETHSLRDETPTPTNEIEVEKHIPVVSLRSVFENGNHHPVKRNHRHSSVSHHSNISHSRRTSQQLNVEIPLLSRVVINDALANGRGNASPGSIAALHKSILEGNENLRPRVVHSPKEQEDEEEETKSQLPHQKSRKPKTLANFYKRWGQTPQMAV
ncbi:hypothetical protein M3Y94_00302300 [Aphelenchoides besseyi]|nr:hypothetical protein M3Y94_00302300 [Aphelenchoides besseyi]KAI6235819.1 hypothetical protein M3Y95_00091900 [Aphelenchoides besseyi]